MVLENSRLKRYLEKLLLDLSPIHQHTIKKLSTLQRNSKLTSANGSFHGTKTTTNLFELIENEFNQYEEENKVVSVNDSTLSNLVYANLAFNNFRVSVRHLTKSHGIQGGTHGLKDVRLKFAQNEQEAHLAVKINEYVRSIFPKKVVFSMVAVPPEDLLTNKVAILSRNFDGKTLIHAPQEVFLEHLTDSIKLTQKKPDFLNYRVEGYGGKWGQTKDVLVHEYKLPVKLQDDLSMLEVHLRSKAITPFWDQNCESGNTKFNEDGKIAWFDFDQAASLVHPLHEAAQIIYSYGQQEVFDEAIDIVKKSYEQSKILTDSFDMQWDIVTTYFLARQLARGYELKHLNEKNDLINKYENLLLNTKIGLDVAKHLQDAINNYKSK